MIIQWYRELFLFLWKYLGFFGGIVGISVIVSLICIPLYRVVGRIVGMENALQSALGPAVVRIKETFNDPAERQAAIERLYARFGYHPIMGVRKVFPLFVAIPFLMLTYYMLSGTTELEGVKWLCFSDVSKPDGMLFGFNLLPFVMTGVNLLTVYATPCFNKKDEAQSWAIAILFLVLLYSANTALMIYWTLNQIFNFSRTLCESHYAGAKLLARRFAMIHALPIRVHQWLIGFPQKIWAIGSLVFVLLTAYMFMLAAFKVGGKVGTIASGQMQNALAVSSVLLMLAAFRFEYRLRVLVWSCAIPAILYAMLHIILYIVVFHIINPTLYTSLALEIDGFLWIVVCLVFQLLPLIGLAITKRAGAFRDFHSVIRSDGFLLLLPLALAVHYAFSSSEFLLRPFSVLMLCIYMTIPCVLITCFLSLLYRPVIPVICVFRVVVGVWVGIAVLPMIASESGFLDYKNNFAIRVAAMVAVPCLLSVVRNRKLLAVFSVMLFAVSVCTAIVNRCHTVSDDIKEPDFVVTDVSKLLQEAACVHSNNVYLLVYDGYAHRLVLEALGLADNSPYDFLKERGFTFYDAYGPGRGTVDNMSACFTLGGVAGGSPRSTMAGDNPFSDFLQYAGYKTSYVICGFTMPNRGERMPGDYYFPSPQAIIRPELVLMPCILRGAFSQTANVFNDYTQEEWASAKRSVISKSGGFCNFLYAHSSLPGHVNWYPKYRQSDKEEQQTYKERLDAATAELRDDVEQILAKDRNAIVILASDHGGFLMIPDELDNPDARNLLDHQGILLAIRWPSDYKPCVNIQSIQNALVEVLVYLTDCQKIASLVSDNAMHNVGFPMGNTKDAVRDGVIQFGPDAGKSLFTAAEEAFRGKRKVKFVPGYDRKP